MCALDICPNTAQLLHDPFIPAVNVIHAVNQRLAATNPASPLPAALSNLNASRLETFRRHRSMNAPFPGATIR